VRIGIYVHSESGNTLSVAEAIKEKIQSPERQIEIIHLKRPDGIGTDVVDFKFDAISQPNEFDAILFGAPVNAFSLSSYMKAFMNQINSLDGKKVLCFMTQAFPYKWLGGNKGMEQLTNLCIAKNGVVVGKGIVNWHRENKDSIVKELAANFEKNLFGGNISENMNNKKKSRKKIFIVILIILAVLGVLAFNPIKLIFQKNELKTKISDMINNKILPMANYSQNFEKSGEYYDKLNFVFSDKFDELTLEKRFEFLRDIAYEFKTNRESIMLTDKYDVYKENRTWMSVNPKITVKTTKNNYEYVPMDGMIYNGKSYTNEDFESEAEKTNDIATDNEIHDYMQSIWQGYEETLPSDESEARVYIDASKKFNISIIDAYCAWVTVENININFNITRNEVYESGINRLSEIGFENINGVWKYGY